MALAEGSNLRLTEQAGLVEIRQVASAAAHSARRAFPHPVPVLPVQSLYASSPS